MEVTLELTDSQLLNLLNISAFELKKKYPNLTTEIDANYSKLFKVLENTVEDEEKRFEIHNALSAYLVSLKLTQAKIGIQAGINLAKGNINIV